jgi:hypothetical protein
MAAATPVADPVLANFLPDDSNACFPPKRDFPIAPDDGMAAPDGMTGDSISEANDSTRSTWTGNSKRLRRVGLFAGFNPSAAP